MDEIQTKKCEKKRKLFHPLSDKTEFYLTKVVAMGCKSIGSLNVFPLEFQAAFDGLVFNDMKHFSIIKCGSMFYLPNHDSASAMPIDAVYWGRDRYSKGEFEEAHDIAMKFNAAEWILSSETRELTSSDEAILSRFRTELIAFMDDCISIVKGDQRFDEKTLTVLTKERMRFATVSDANNRMQTSALKRRKTTNEKRAE